MKNTFFLLCSFFMIFSCISKKITIYHYDNSKYDGAEIDGSRLKYFFSKENNDIKIFDIRSSNLDSELMKIITKTDSVKNRKGDRGYYYYVFISKKDTLYSDYNLEYWSNKNNGIAYKLDKNVKEEIKKSLADSKTSTVNK